MAARTPGDDHHTVSLGRAFGRAFAIIRAHPLLTIGTTFAMTMIPGLLFNETSVSQALTGAYYGALTNAFFLKMMMGWVVQLFLWAVAVAAVIQAGLAHAEGRSADFGEILYTGGMRSLPLLAVYLLYSIAIMVGIGLLVIPGIFIAVIWSMAMVAMVAEEPGLFGAFRRSVALEDIRDSPAGACDRPDRQPVRGTHCPDRGASTGDAGRRPPRADRHVTAQHDRRDLDDDDVHRAVHRIARMEGRAGYRSAR